MISLVITESVDIKFNSKYGLIQLKQQFDINTIFKIIYNVFTLRFIYVFQKFKKNTLASEIDAAYGRYMVVWHVSLRKNLFLELCIYFRKPLLGNLFVVDRIFFGGLRLEDIQYCHWWKLKTAEVETVEISASSFDCISDSIFRYPFFRFAVYCFNQYCEQCKGFSEQKIKK